MNSKTNKKLIFLQKYCEKQFNSFKSLYPNITGLHVGLKSRDDSFLRYNALVFHVTKKNSVGNSIPKKIAVQFPDKTIIEVPTDIIEAGNLELTSGAVSAGDMIESRTTGELGSCGLIIRLKKRNYFVSNMHVMAKNYITDSHSYYQRKPSMQVVEVLLGKSNPIKGILKAAAFTPMLDLAIAEIRTSDLGRLSNSINNIGTINGYYNATAPTNRNRSIRMKGAFSGVRSSKISDTRVTKQTNFKYGTHSFSHTFKGVTKMTDDISVSGDSGGLVVDNLNRAVGIVVGSDGKNSYYIPIIDIRKYIGNFSIYK